MEILSKDITALWWHTCLFAGPLCIIMEFAPHGNLRDFLIENRPPLHDTQRTTPAAQMEVTYKHLLRFAVQVAWGMRYLSSQQVSN